MLIKILLYVLQFLYNTRISAHYAGKLLVFGDSRHCICFFVFLLVFNEYTQTVLSYKLRQGHTTDSTL